MRKKKVKRLIEKQGVKKGHTLSIRSGLTSFTLLQKRPLAVGLNLGQACSKWSHIATFSALPTTHQVSTIEKPPPPSKCREILVDSSVVSKRRCFDGPEDRNIRSRQYLTTERLSTTKIAINCPKTLFKRRLFILYLLYLVIIGHQITVISSSFSRARQNFAQEYFVNSPVDHQITGFAGNSAKPARIDLLDKTATTTSDGILIQTKQGIFRGKLIENVARSEVRYNNNNNDRIGVSKNKGKHKVIGFLGKFWSKFHPIQLIVSMNSSMTNKVKSFLCLSSIRLLTGIRYASAPVRRLRFMPPTAFYYAPNQIHNAQKFGPICKQRWPIELVGVEDSSQVEPEASASNSSLNLELQLRLIRRIMAGDTFTLLKPLIKQLARREQSEDCLNLNIYLPYKGKFCDNFSK